ncbi:MAG: hypothetical protein GY866_29780 [Proteobacteria bacterium]|nr:hypothetical protein [Pseudomonadota bacterium]
MNTLPMMVLGLFGTFIVLTSLGALYFQIKIKLGFGKSFMAVWVYFRSIPLLLKKNESHINEDLKLETWDLVNDGRHNSNSFLIHWRDEFWLAHASSIYHFATPECKLVVWRSRDAKSWTPAFELRVPGEDIRDPKFAVIKDKLFMYVLKSIDFNPEPYGTAYVATEDGENWTELKELTKNEGWLFWNPRTFDGKNFYTPAYWFLHGKSVLLKTTDGIDFEYISTIHNGKSAQVNDRNDETDISFHDDGTMISTQRLEYSENLHGDKRACTNITLSKPPYDAWTEIGKDYTTRLDGPCLFTHNNRVYAVGRYNPTVTRRKFMGSLFTVKRTSLFLVTEKGLVRLSDFPSCGDTSYGGVVLKDGCAYATYYTNDIEKEWPWLYGMIQPSHIRLAKIPLDALERVASEKFEEYESKGLFKLNKAAGSPRR